MTMTTALHSCNFEVSPRRPDAGAPMQILARLVTEDREDLRGSEIEIRDHVGALVGTAPVTSFDGEVNGTAPVSATAPDTPGSHDWSMSLALMGASGAPEAGLVESVPFQIDVKPHATRLEVWDVPTAIEAGSAFSLKIGMKCSSECDLSGREFSIESEAGETLAEGTITGEIWPASTGLYWQSVRLVAPEEEGFRRWTLKARPARGAHAHGEAVTSFGVRTVPPADHVVRIEAFEVENETPLANMTVTMFPYRARTDESGVAEIHAAKGTYAIFVSGRGYYPVRREIDVTADMTTRAPLEAEPPQSSDW